MALQCPYTGLLGPAQQITDMDRRRLVELGAQCDNRVRIIEVLLKVGPARDIVNAFVSGWP